VIHYDIDDDIILPLAKTFVAFAKGINADVVTALEKVGNSKVQMDAWIGQSNPVTSFSQAQINTRSKSRAKTLLAQHHHDLGTTLKIGRQLFNSYQCVQAHLDGTSQESIRVSKKKVSVFIKVDSSNLKRFTKLYQRKEARPYVFAQEYKVYYSCTRQLRSIF
jgi:hypothetical protein